MPLSKHKYIAVIGVVALAAFAYFALCYQYHFYYKEQNQIFLLTAEFFGAYTSTPAWLANYIGDLLTTFFYYKFLGPFIVSMCIFLLGIYTYKALSFIRLRHIKTIACIVAVIVMLLEFAFHLDINYQLAATIGKTMLVVTIWQSIFMYKRCRWCAVQPIIIFTLVTIPYGKYYKADIKQYIGAIHAPEPILESDFAVDNEYYFGNYSRVLDIVQHAPAERITKEMLFFYYLSAAQVGELPEHLLDFSNPYLGTFENIGPQTPHILINNMNELYWLVGDMTYAERAAMMNHVFSPQNRNVRMVKRMAEINLVTADTAAAMKYLRVLERTPIYRNWAQRHMPHNQSEVIKRQIVTKQSLTNATDTMQYGDNAYVILTQLLNSNPANDAALNYLLCSDLLLKQMDTFWRDYNKYYGMRQHRKLYDEALCIYLAGTNATQEQWQQAGISADVIARFDAYSQQRGNSSYSDTYWYYFDTHK